MMPMHSFHYLSLSEASSQISVALPVSYNHRTSSKLTKQCQWQQAISQPNSCYYTALYLPGQQQICHHQQESDHCWVKDLADFYLSLFSSSPGVCKQPWKLGAFRGLHTITKESLEVSWIAPVQAIRPILNSLVHFPW
jgi:hypothetical protein